MEKVLIDEKHQAHLRQWGIGMVMHECVRSWLGGGT